MHRVGRLLVGLVMLVGAAAAGPAQAAQACRSEHWVTGWSTSPVATVAGLDDRSYRSVHRVQLAGTLLRLRLTNTLGAGEVSIDAMTIGRSAGGAEVVPGSLLSLTFHGRQRAVIPAGAELWSDPFRRVRPGLDRRRHGAAALQGEAGCGRGDGESSGEEPGGGVVAGR